MSGADSSRNPAPARKRRAAPPGEWNRDLPQDARMWAIVASEYGKFARHTMAGFRQWGEEFAVANEDSLLFFVRTAATCARMVLGDVKPPRPLEWNPSSGKIGVPLLSPGTYGSQSAENTIRKLDERERARVKGPRFDMSWPEWFATRFPAAFIVADDLEAQSDADIEALFG